MKKKENEFNNPERIYVNPATLLDKGAAVAKHCKKPLTSGFGNYSSTW